MSERRESRDPFAGYTPVKVSRVADGSDVPPLPTGAAGRKYRFGAKKESDFSRSAKLVGWGAVSAVLVVLVAAVSHGFIYERPVGEDLSELDAYTNQLQRLSEAGRRIRGKMRGATDAVLPSKPGVKKTEAPPADDPAPVTNAVAPAAESPAPRAIDPSLKRFYNGGRKGRPIR